MSLNYDLTHVADWQALRDLDTNGGSIIQTVVFEMMICGIGKLTKKNLVELVARSRYWRDLDTFGGGNPIPFEYFVRMIGVATNVTTETKAAWLKRMSHRFHAERYHKALKEFDRYIEEQARSQSHSQR